MIDLEAEFAGAVAVVPIDDDGPLAKWLARRGLTAPRRRMVGGIGVTRAIVTPSTRTYEPFCDGERVLVAPVWDGPAPDVRCPGYAWHPSNMVDLVAWQPAEPARLFLRLGLGTHIGADGLRQALATASPIRAHRTVEGFVAAGGETGGEHPAVVILNAGFTFALLRDVVSVIADDLEHGEELAATLEAQRPPPPPIRIPVERCGVAA